MNEVTAIGELLIDFTPDGYSKQNKPLYEQNPGGAPANVLACLSRLGHQTAFIGKVGKDQFGSSLKKTLVDCGISTQGLIMTERYPTTLAFVHLNEQGDRSFSFYRNHGADMMLETTDLSYNLIDDCLIFHFGSVSMTDNPAREATMDALRYAAIRLLTLKIYNNTFDWYAILKKGVNVACQKSNIMSACLMMNETRCFA